MSGWRFLMRGFFPPEGFPGRTEKIFYSYPSPTVVIPALCLLLLHLRIRPGKHDALIQKLSSAALGVFLLHTTVWNWLIAPLAGLLSPLPQSFAWLNVLGSAMFITLLCIPVDLARGRLFKVLHVRELADGVQARFFSLCGKLGEKAE